MKFLRRASEGNPTWSGWGLLDADKELIAVGETRKSMREIREPRSGERIVLVEVKLVGIE